MTLKRLLDAPNTAEAELIRMELEAEGIRAFVHGSAIHHTLGDLSPFGSTRPQVWVHEADLDAAALVVESYRAGDHHYDHAGPWVCPTCGEQVDGQFAVCWQCETPNPRTADADADAAPPETDTHGPDETDHPNA